MLSPLGATINEVLAFFMGPMSAPAMALLPEAARTAALTIPMFLFVGLHDKLSTTQRAIRQSVVETEVGVRYSNQTMEHLRQATTTGRCLFPFRSDSCRLTLTRVGWCMLSTP
jgi:hypothetical protein